MRERKWRLFRNLLEKHVPSKEVHHVHFHSENPWQSRRIEGKRNHLVELVWHLFAKTTRPPTVRRSFWSLRTFCNFCSGLICFFKQKQHVYLICISAAQDAIKSPSPGSCPTREWLSVHNWCFPVSMTNPDAVNSNHLLSFWLTDAVALTDSLILPSFCVSVELATSFKCPLRGTSINIKARLHPCKNVAHLRFAAASGQIINLSHG